MSWEREWVEYEEEHMGRKTKEQLISEVSRFKEQQANKPHVVYVSGPLSASDPELVARNIRIAVMAGANLMKEGKMPYVPHSNFDGFNRHYDFSWKDYMRPCLEMLKRSDSVFMMKSWKSSRGARIEERMARFWHKPIIYERSTNV